MADEHDREDDDEPARREYATDPTQANWIIEEFEEQITELFEHAKKKLIAIVPNPDEKTHAVPASKLPTLLKQVDAVLEEVNAEGDLLAREEIEKGYLQGRIFASIQLGAPLAVRKAIWAEIADLIVLAASDYQGITDATAAKIRFVIANGVTAGKSLGEIVQDIINQVDDIGIRRAITWVRTEVMKAVNIGVVNRYKEAGLTITGHGKIPPYHPNCRCTVTVQRREGKMVMVVLVAEDERTCEICMELDGTVV